MHKVKKKKKKKNIRASGARDDGPAWQPSSGLLGYHREKFGKLAFQALALCQSE